MHLFRVFFRTMLCAVLPLCLLGGGMTVAAYTGTAPQEKAAGANLRVMSYNVLVDDDESLGGWSWGQALGNRGDKAAACIAYYQPDVIGFQECNYKWHVSLRENLPDYDFVNADVPAQQYLEKSESLGKKDWMCTTMMYNTKTLKLVSNELVGYSVNYWGCIQRMRYVSIAVFEIKATGERFTFFSTHLDAEKDEKGQRMRLTQSEELVACIQRYKSTYGYPVIGTGDFNSGFGDDPLQNVVSKTGMTASANNRSGIDYVVYSAGVQSQYFTTVTDSDVAGASDHKPVFADLKVETYAFPTTKATEETSSTTGSDTQPKAQSSAMVVTKSTTAQTIVKSTAKGDGTADKTATTTTGVDVASTKTDATDAVDDHPTETDHSQTAPQESVPTVEAQPELDAATPVVTVEQEEGGLSAPVLALIGAGGALVLLAAGVGIYLLVNRKK